jgi:hypothetical protein
MTSPLPTLGAGYVGAWRGNARWSLDGASASGLIDYTVTEEGAYRCHGVFDVAFTRQ